MARSVSVYGNNPDSEILSLSNQNWGKNSKNRSFFVIFFRFFAWVWFFFHTHDPVVFGCMTKSWWFSAPYISKLLYSFQLWQGRTSQSWIVWELTFCLRENTRKKPFWFNYPKMWMHQRLNGYLFTVVNSTSALGMLKKEVLGLVVTKKTQLAEFELYSNGRITNVSRN